MDWRAIYKSAANPSYTPGQLYVASPHLDPLPAVNPTTGGTSPTEHAKPGVADGSPGDSP